MAVDQLHESCVEVFDVAKDSLLKSGIPLVEIEAAFIAYQDEVLKASPEPLDRAIARYLEGRHRSMVH